MKNILNILFIFIATLSFGQSRYVDSRVEFASPEEGITITSPLYLPFTLKVVNQGPDSLFPGDLYAYTINAYGYGDTIKKRTLTQYLAPNDSMYITDSIWIDNKKDFDLFPLWFIDALSFYNLLDAPNAGRRLQPELWDDKQDNYPQLNLRHKRSRVSVAEVNSTQIAIYPNPVSGQEINISGISKGTPSLSCYNTLGEVVANGMVIDGKFKLPALVSGLYFIALESESGAVTKKIMIQHP